MLCRSLLVVNLLLCLAHPLWAQTREQKVREDRKKIEAEGFWLYNNLTDGFAEAKKTNKPIVVVLRCIPCEECVKLDDDLVQNDKRIRPLLEKFVRVRQVGTNGLDLSLFQYDYDQSFAVFFLNADGTIYGRFGTRSHRTSWTDDVSIDGLANAMQGALDLHAEYPKNQASLVAKKGPAPEYARPELIPKLKEKYTSTLNYEGNVVQSCIHCHQIGDAYRDLARAKKQPLPDSLLFPYPHPKALGLILDPKEKATVLRAEPNTSAAAAGFQPGDKILKLMGQPLLSLADVQWVLHHTASEASTLKANVQRGEKQIELTWSLPKGWRQLDDISWRSSSWGLRRMATGGLVLESISDDDRKQAGLTKTDGALRVKYVGQYNAHAAARNAGFQKDDLLLSLGDRKDLTRETDWFIQALTAHKAGEKVAVMVLRGGKKLTLQLPMQE